MVKFLGGSCHILILERKKLIGLWVVSAIFAFGKKNMQRKKSMKEKKKKHNLGGQIEGNKKRKKRGTKIL
jgi:hypothetical protein